MSLGALAKVKNVGQVPSAPTYADLITVVGDAAYSAGGSAGFLAAFQALVGQARAIVGVQGCSDPATLSELEYDFTNDKLFARVRTTGVESAVSDQHLVTYRLLVISK
jgi:hypothetical protein